MPERPFVLAKVDCLSGRPRILFPAVAQSVRRSAGLRALKFNRADLARTEGCALPFSEGPGGVRPRMPYAAAMPSERLLAASSSTTQTCAAKDFVRAAPTVACSGGRKVRLMFRRMKQIFSH